jgi:hypothetical protein
MAIIAAMVPTQSDEIQKKYSELQTALGLLWTCLNAAGVHVS